MLDDGGEDEGDDGDDGSGGRGGGDHQGLSAPVVKNVPSWARIAAPQQVSAALSEIPAEPAVVVGDSGSNGEAEAGVREHSEEPAGSSGNGSDGGGGGGAVVAVAAAAKKPKFGKFGKDPTVATDFLPDR